MFLKTIDDLTFGIYQFLITLLSCRASLVILKGGRNAVTPPIQPLQYISISVTVWSHMSSRKQSMTMVQLTRAAATSWGLHATHHRAGGGGGVRVVLHG